MKHFLNGAAAMALAIAAASCSSDSELYVPTTQEVMDNAKEKLGVDIDPNQDWNMTAKATASITVNGDYGETYTVKIYSNDPLMDRKGYILAKGEVQNGETFETTFEYASASSSLIVGITNSKGFTYYKSVAIADGVLRTVIGGQPSGARGPMKSQASPEVPHITIPTDTYAKSFLEGAKEPNAENTTDNYDDSHFVQGGTYVPGDPWGWGWQGVGSNLYNNRGSFNESWFTPASVGATQDEYDWFVEFCMPFANGNWAYYGVDNENDAVPVLFQLLKDASYYDDWVTVWHEGSQGHYEGGGEGHWEYDETFVTKFKITGTYNDGINVLSTEEDASKGTKARSVYIGEGAKWVVTGPWNGAEQRVGGGAVIVVDNGGELNIPEGKYMTFVNEARLVVMPGGRVTGGGKIIVTNGNAEGLEGYNGGSIDIGTFNNNFGKFYNYGTFKSTNLEGGAGLSNFYNHGVAHIVRSGVAESWGGNYNTPNTRIFNACQWYCEQDMRAYVVEMAPGSYFYVGGELQMSDGTDGTAVNSYVALANGALMSIHSLRNNNCSWQGPTSGYAVVELGQVTYLNWTGEPISQGYFINNIAVSVDDKTVGAGNGQGTDTYVALRDFVANGHGSTGNYFDPIGKQTVGNGGVVMVNKGGANISFDGSENFIAGQRGCSPGYNGTPAIETYEERPSVWSYAFEDSPLGDYDMNDVVIKVNYHYDESTQTVDESKLDVTLCCTGASFNLRVYLNQADIFGMEVHDVFRAAPGSFVNTQIGGTTATPVTVTIDKPQGFSFQNADFWISSPAVPDGVHIAKQGEDPHGIVIPEDWQWPTEFTNIKDAYPNFIEFAKDASTTDTAVKGWYKTTDTNPVADKVYQ